MSTNEQLAQAVRDLIDALASEGRAPGGFSVRPATSDHQRRVQQAWRGVHSALAAHESCAKASEAEKAAPAPAAPVADSSVAFQYLREQVARQMVNVHNAFKSTTPAAPVAVPMPEPAHRERVYAGHGNEDVYEWYTAAQMREREAATIAACAARCEAQASRWADDRAKYIAHECAAALRAPAAPVAVPLTARAIWHETDGPVTWWAWNGETREWASEPPWVGTPLDSDWPGYHTHWTPCPDVPAKLKGGE